ncbi:DUF1269 domain-containing protein [Pengzhenrongella frigida]|uniref:DUF1269 domain-containing protein n=1 Tax=Pengzhenrongella frigida TaxID=1259133 RepID=A0A4Q5N1L2_9MICO|nr:DUF1269 domain-containing protein [Cellulomonas sp. HLT2-17]RYV51955.1 DUF1269 domain-containing protein [Cellulomonas sp. HLT2-17]
MTTFTVWKYESPDGAQEAADILRSAASEGLVKIVDHAVVSWPLGASKPVVKQPHDDERRGAGWGALWGLLLGSLFFVPLLGAAAGAALGASSKAMEAIGIDKKQFETLKGEVVPGTSALFVVTTEGELDRIAERFHGLHSTLVTSNLSATEEQTLHEAFG